MPAKTRTRAFGLSSLVRPQGLSNPWRIFSIGQTFVNFRTFFFGGLKSSYLSHKSKVAFHAINARRLPLASLVYTLMTTSVVTNSVFRGFFEKQKLTGPNFIDWYRQLRIVLSVMDKLDYQEQPIPPAPVPAQAGQQVAPEALTAHAAWVNGSKGLLESCHDYGSEIHYIWKTFG
ncbi:hypothetical protein Tco_0815603 [Tanacetum coccineum]